MSISHESVHEWWDGSRIDDSERLEVANAINDNSILEKAYNDLNPKKHFNINSFGPYYLAKYCNKRKITNLCQ